MTDLAATCRQRNAAILLWLGGLIAAIALGLYASPPALPPGSGRVFPRMSAPAPDVRTLLYMLGIGSIVWFMAVVALPALMWGARRVDRGGNRAQAVIIAGLAVVTLFAASSAIQFFMLFRGAPVRPSFPEYLPAALRQDLLPWVALVGIVAAIESRRRARAGVVEHERLRAEVAEQRLIALTGQLQPHFLFNTLQGISTLIHRDADAADEMLSRLSDLLRELLRHRESGLVTLDEEMRFTRTFLEIAEIRFADRLRFDIEVQTALERALVPLFILQPLVENALSHGIGALAEGGRVTIRASRDAGALVLEVHDDGTGVVSAREGVGLRNTRERLRASFGDEQSLTLSSRSPHGTVARIRLPWRESPSS
ncbi:MAG: histidine kinase [Gemmatimonadaceae bacterium]